MIVAQTIRQGRGRAGGLLTDRAIRRRLLNTAASDSNIFNYRLPTENETNRKGPLAAWTVSIKDNICTNDMPTTCSSKMLESYTSPFEATTVRLLREAGANIMGKTNCDEFGMGSMNLDSAFGPVHNPRVPNGQPPRVAGGSSGGAAASVAAKHCRVAIGSDTGGSIRLPAAYCGVYGFKPSYGLISRWGLVSYADSLDTIGIIASRHDEVKETFDVLSQYDDRDPTSISQDVRNKAEKVAGEALQGIGKSGNLNGLCIGVPQQFFAKEVHPRVMPSVRKTLSTLKQLGVEIVPVNLPNIKYALSAYYVLASAEASSNLARYDGIRFGHRSDELESAEEVQGRNSTKFAKHIAKTRSEGFGKEVKKRILLGTYSLTSELFDNYFLQAQRVRQLVRKDLDRAFCLNNVMESTQMESRTGVHAILHPSAVDIAPLVSEAKERGVETYTQDLLTVPASLAGLPSISVPAGRAEGMPVGITISTQWGCEPILWRILQNIGP
ncbi:amidase signature enzyme [Meira miltonrushii]|uniref:Glutamyl-tRNA(Gln) amidotransferase subunit A, mitochondrial n=1 Tax=Meira miltonrushii TaxID=1280837 RepID=A0A316VK79_9BASI|nr:amidase signature enzyme [Meira miltonrushii]PWN37920.1 amidase signature enzyme [Meira miltonrushii]